MLLITACGSYSASNNSGGGTYGGGGGGTPGTPANSIYVTANPFSGSSSILQLPKSATGSPTPTLTITTPATLLLTNLTIDAAGSLYVGGQLFSGNTAGMSEVLQYAPGASGTAAPVRTLGGISQSAGQIQGLAVDTTGNLYVKTALPLGGGVPHQLNTGIAVYGPTNSNTNAPDRFITGSATHVNGGNQIAADAAATVYTGANAAIDSPSIYAFDTNANGNVAPTRTITGSNTMLYNVQGIAVDTVGNVYVASLANDGQGTLNGTPSILEFAAGASGNVAPMRIISGAATTMGELHNISVDTAGDIYVVTQALGGNHVLKFASTATGNVAPVSTIAVSSIYSFADAMVAP